MCTFITVIILNIFVGSYCSKLFVIKIVLLPQVMYSVFGVVPGAHVTWVLSPIMYAEQSKE